jgi:hypothetical protein
MDALVTKPCSQLQYPEIVHSGPKHKFCIFLHSVGFQNASKTLPNNILGLMDMKGCVGYETIFATQVLHLFTFRRFPKCSENTPKQHFSCNADEWMPWLQNHFRNFTTQNSAFTPKIQILHLFTYRCFLKCSKTLPIIILGPMQMNGCFCYETIFPALVPRKSAFTLETEVYVFLHSIGLWNAPKHPDQHFGSSAA